jgi:hypothetical protein
MATLAKLPPVPFTAETARLAVSRIASVTVAFPVTKDEIVSVMDDIGRSVGWYRDSNQLALKSKREKTRTKRRMLQ